MSSSQQALFMSTAAAGGFVVTHSLDFTSAGSQNMTRAWGAASDRTKWTFSAWFKKTTVSGYHIFFSSWTANSDTAYLALYHNTSDNKFYVSGWITSFVSGTAVISDTTTWHHICIKCDTTDATANNRIKMYIDGADVTNVVSTVGSSASLGIGQNATHRIGVGEGGSVGYANTKMADIYFIDGIALDYTNFYNAGHPKQYTGSFGTKGFWLTFFNDTSTTTLGLDDAGGAPGSAAGANDWTLTNFTTADSTTDVPT